MLRAFEPVFSERIWEWAKILLVGALLAPGKRTVTSALRVMSLSGEAQYQNYQRGVESCRVAELRPVVAVFVPLVLGLDDPIEHLPGCAVRSSKSFFVKTSGLRWVLMLDPGGKFATQALLCTAVTPNRQVVRLVLVIGGHFSRSTHPPGP